MRQIITIKPDGSLFGMDHKEAGVRLQSLGPAVTRRATLIEWVDSAQRWSVFELDAGGSVLARWGADMFALWGLDRGKFNGVEKEGLLLFDSYSDAVSFEVAIIQAQQLAGKRLAV